jgi:hypothetical protein
MPSHVEMLMYETTLKYDATVDTLLRLVQHPVMQHP